MVISIQELILGLGFSQPTTHKHVSIQIYTKFHTKIIESIPFSILFSFSSFLLLFLFIFFFFSPSSLSFTVCSPNFKTKFGLKSNFKLRPCLAFAYLNIFLIFAIRPFHSLLFLIALTLITSSIYISFFSNSIWAYKLMVLCLSYPQVAKD